MLFCFVSSPGEEEREIRSEIVLVVVLSSKERLGKMYYGLEGMIS